MTKSSHSRRAFLKAGAGAAALAGMGTTHALAKAPAALSGKREWRMAMTWPKSLPGLGVGASRLAERITVMSEGQLTVTPYGAGELTPALGVFDACADGSIEMAHAAPYYWLAKNPAFAFFCAVPGGLTAQEQTAWFYYGGGLKLMHALYAEFGLVSFPAGNTGAQMGGWFNRPIHSLEDMKGLKIRMPGLAGEIVTRLGASPQTIPGGELYTAMQQGVIDALEWVGPWNDMAFGFHRIANYYYGPGFHEGGASLELMINRKAYESLTPELKRIVKAACATETMLMTSEYYANNVTAFAELQKIDALTIGRYPDDVQRAMFELSEEVLHRSGEVGGINRRIYESFAGFREKSMRMLPVMEYGFLDSRNKYSDLDSVKRNKNAKNDNPT